MADAGVLKLEIVTPDGVALRESVQSFTATSVDGEFGVLPGHCPLLAALKTGIVSFVKNGVEEKVVVGPGFAEVYADHATLLTDHMMRKADVDPVRARLDLKDADEALDRYAGEPGTTEYLDLMRKELWAAARLTLYGDPPPPTLHTYDESLAGPHETFLDDPNDHAAEEATH